MVSQQQVNDALQTINDPEMPISIVDLGIVDRITIGPEGTVEVDLLPTFVGCPALPVIENTICEKVGSLSGVRSVQVQVKYEPAWSVDRISEAGRQSLKRFGVTVPHARCHESREEEQRLTCPFCGSPRVRLESPFGPTRCRMIYYCEACRHPFEHLKRVPLASLKHVEGPSQN
jgi:ring-1,2-phenylacetyl-CoA epoxidase subunit PaaD